jgi:hypothetical protein
MAFQRSWSKHREEVEFHGAEQDFEASKDHSEINDKRWVEA